VIVLDTHALVWWVNGDNNLSQVAQSVIEDALLQGERVLVSAITAWEIAMLVERGRMSLAMSIDNWLIAVGSLEGLEIVPVSAAVAVQSTRLPGEFHKDPADRMIVALARERNATLVTADEKIRAYPHVRVVW